MFTHGRAISNLLRSAALGAAIVYYIPVCCRLVKVYLLSQHGNPELKLIKQVTTKKSVCK
jgi:hypothetical protein